MARRKLDPNERKITARPEVSDDVVKSAARVLQILEFFDDVQCEATVIDVSENLGYPQSSTSALLRSLVSLGYLHHNPRNRTYITSSRVALLGSWVNRYFFQDGKVIRLMKDLNQLTGDTVVLATRNGLQAQYIHVLQATSSVRLHLTLGSVRPLAGSGAGLALLSTMQDAEVTRLVNRINAEQQDPTKIVKVRELLTTLGEVRRVGYAFTTNMVTQGGGILAAPLPRIPGQPPLVVGIGGVSEVMTARKQELLQILRDTFRKHLSPQKVTDNTKPATPPEQSEVPQALAS